MPFDVTSVPLLSLVEPGQAAALERLFHPVRLEAGQVLFEQGKPCDWLWVVGSDAEVSVTRVGEAGSEVMVAHLGAGDTVGEMALVDEGPRSGTARVVVGGTAAVMASTDFYALRDAYHPAAFQLLRKICLELCWRLRGTSDRLAAPSPAADAPATQPLRAGRAAPEHLDALPNLRVLPRVVKLALAQKLGRLELPHGTTVCVEGAPGDAAYFIASGAVRVVRGSKPLARLRAGEVFGMVALMDGGPRSATCLTEGPASLLRLGRTDFEQLFASANRFAFQLVEGMARQLVRNLRAADLLLARPEVPFPPQPAPPRSLFFDAEVASQDFGKVPDSEASETPPA